MSPVFPWYYIWSPKYEIFHRILHSSIHHLEGQGFQIRPQFFPQSFFDKGLSTDPTKHAFEGLSIKLKLLVWALEKHVGQHVLISDADLIVTNPDALYTYLQNYTDKDQSSAEQGSARDIVFMAESREHPTANLGFGMVKSTPHTIAFFKRLAEHIDAEGGHDQTLYNVWIEEGRFEGSTGVFSLPEMLQSNNYTQEMEAAIEKDPSSMPMNIMVQFLCSQSNYVANTVEKLKSALCFVDISEIIGCVSEEVFEDLKSDLDPEHPLHGVSYPQTGSKSVPQSNPAHTE